MLDLDTRIAILKLRDQGHGTRAIARALGVSRGSVKRITAHGDAVVPARASECPSEQHVERIRQLYVTCEGSLVRVHEELQKEGVDLGYSTLTWLCRNHDIGVQPKRASGSYHFEPAQESQHDTSPHDVKIGGKMRRVQCASLVLCFSRCIYAQVFARFTRFQAKTFLTEAAMYFHGTTGRIVVDNTSVLVSHGSGASAVFAPEMQVWAERFGTRFMAHEKGDANRSARVERPFWFIETNFYKGRTFENLRDLNSQLLDWCNKVNTSHKPKLRFIPNDRLALEQPALRPLPIHVPEVYDIHERLVDIEAYVAVHSNRYSVPERFIHRTVQVHESKDRIRVFCGHELLAEHIIEDPGLGKRSTLPEHRIVRPRRSTPVPTAAESALSNADPLLAQMVAQLKSGKGHSGFAIRRLFGLWRDYPREPVLTAIEQALHYGLTDIVRIETMILDRVRGDFFRFDSGDPS